MIAAILASLLLLWRYGKEQQWFAEAEDRFPTSHVISTSTTTGIDSQINLKKRHGQYPISTTRGLGIFFDKAGETTPIVFSQFVLKLTAIPEVTVFFHLRPLDQPSVAPENRYTLSRLAIPNFYRLVVKYGYNDEIITPNLSSVIVEQVRKYLVKSHHSPSAQCTVETPTGVENDSAATNANTSTQPGETSNTGNSANQNNGRKLAKLEAAYSHKVLSILSEKKK